MQLTFKFKEKDYYKSLLIFKSKVKPPPFKSFRNLKGFRVDNLITTNGYGKPDWRSYCSDCYNKKILHELIKIGSDSQHYLYCSYCNKWSGPWCKAECSPYYGY